MAVIPLYKSRMMKVESAVFLKKMHETQKLVWVQFAGGLSLPSQNQNMVFRRVGQGVKTPPFHGGITGSNPVRGTKSRPKGGIFCLI